jgi:hypothetical protein
MRFSLREASGDLSTCRYWAIASTMLLHGLQSAAGHRCWRRADVFAQSVVERFLRIGKVDEQTIWRLPRVCLRVGLFRIALRFENKN